MKSGHFLWKAGILPLALGTAVHAAYLQSDYDGTRDRTEAREPVPMPRPGPEPRSGNAIVRLLDRVRVGRPYHYRSLTVFPLVLSRAERLRGIMTLDEALSRDRLVIRENEQASVSELRVRNDSDDHVFLMAGEMLAGGKQNRMIREDVLIPPRSRFIDVPVYCGEKERWTGARDTFSSPRIMAHPELRAGAAKGEAQGSIWSEIDAQSSRAKVRSPTRDYREIYEDRAVRNEIEECARSFRGFVGRDTVGAVAVSGGRVVGCDVFSDPDLMSRLWDKLLRSYGLGVLYGSRERSPSVSQRDIRRFLDSAADARYSESDTPGAGALWRISGAVDGSGLEWRGAAVHAGLFGERLEHRPLPPDDPVPLPGPGPWRREPGIWE